MLCPWVPGFATLRLNEGLKDGSDAWEGAPAGFADFAAKNSCPEWKESRKGKQPDGLICLWLWNWWSAEGAGEPRSPEPHPVHPLELLALWLCRAFQHTANLSLLVLLDFFIMPAQSLSLLLIKSKIIITIWKIAPVFLGIKYLNSQTNGPYLFLLKVHALKCHSKLNVPWKIISFLVTLLFIPFYLHINYPR